MFDYGVELFTSKRKSLYKHTSKVKSFWLQGDIIFFQDILNNVLIIDGINCLIFVYKTKINEVLFN
jgi:hypothetical protein